MSEEERPSVSTGAGDSGFSSLAFGKPIPKDSPVFDLVGTLDELNSVLGICICYTQPDCIEYVKLVQHRLFDIGACIACNKEPSDDLKKFVSFLDKWGVELEKKIPPFQCFILPGGSVGASYYHFARTVCRRLERIEVKAIINEEHGKLYCQIINRLSDVLFILARYHNTAVNVPEIPYESKLNPPI